MYVEAVSRIPWLMDAAETRLLSLAADAIVTGEDFRHLCGLRRPTIDETTAALTALVELGVLASRKDAYVVQKGALAATAGFRQGVRVGLAATAPTSSPTRLCAAIPPGIGGALEAALRASCEDLRGAVVDLAAGAREDLVLASPFWDAATLQDISPVLRARLDAGVFVHVLGRFGGRSRVGASEMMATFTDSPGFELLSWYERTDADPFGASTFHFKTAVADRGARAYLGTANFTSSGLRSRLEIGTLLEGEGARRLYTVVEQVLGHVRLRAGQALK